MYLYIYIYIYIDAVARGSGEPGAPLGGGRRVRRGVCAHLGAQYISLSLYIYIYIYIYAEGSALTSESVMVVNTDVEGKMALN